MTAAHKGMKLTEVEFDAIIELLEQSILDCGVND